MAKKPSNDYSKSNPNVDQQKNPKRRANRRKRVKMPIAIATCLAASFWAFAALVATHNHKTCGVWLTFTGLICALFIPFKMYADAHADLPSNPETTTPMPDEPKQPDIKISSTHQTGGFTGVNTGVVNLAPEGRKISEEQIATFSAALTGAPRGKIQLMQMSIGVECEAFTEHIKRLFTKLGFTVHPIVNRGQIYGQQFPPLTVATQTLDSQSELVKSIQSAFKTIGFESGTQVFPLVQPDTIGILIGERPQ